MMEFELGLLYLAVVRSCGVCFFVLLTSRVMHCLVAEKMQEMKENNCPIESSRKLESSVTWIFYKNCEISSIID